MSRKRDRIYTCWWNMNKRCSDKKTSNYARYGGRGIAVCKEWANSFECFKKWALQNGYQEYLTLDRKDNNGNYCPENCRWITNKKQANNRRTNRIIKFNGQIGTMSEICQRFGLNYELVNCRIQKGWPIEKALTIPKYGYTRKNHLITFQGKTQSIMDWSKELGMKRSILYERIRHGMSIEQALTIPVRERRTGNGSK